MITLNEGNVDMNGTAMELQAELTTGLKAIVDNMRKNGFGEDFIQGSVKLMCRLALMADEEVADEIRKK